MTYYLKPLEITSNKKELEVDIVPPGDAAYYAPKQETLTVPFPPFVEERAEFYLSPQPFSIEVDGFKILYPGTRINLPKGVKAKATFIETSYVSITRLYRKTDRRKKL